MIDQRVIFITGTRKGIGRYLSEYYLDKNMIVCGCSRSESDLKHPNYYHFEVDVTDEKSVIKMVSNVLKKHRRIDYLLNNAGVASMNHSLLTPQVTVEKVFKTNVFGTFSMSREVAKFMAKNKRGRIVNFSSVAAPLNLEGESAYAASKASVEQLTKIFAKEFATYGITCNAIGPSPIYTDLIKNVGKDKIDDLIKRQALKNIATMEDVSNVIDFFISDLSSSITGQIIYLGGIF
ncbi:MAG: SDR family NAD(P)-dependent oxidoreductase [Candidatus Cloacimonetes bacterium]|nr:SDR family NAD(P)-dependent oxidoreductase [Candidatus Cloacimonadota bacterium]